MKKKSSLKDIAKAVGVSISLVSYVLNDKAKENRVSAKTAARVRKAAKDLDYHPNLNARSLKTNKTRTIGVVLADISNPFFANLARAIEDGAFHKDYTVIFGSSDENIVKFNKVLKFMLAKQVDGFIIAAPEGTEEIIKDIVGRGIPMVLIDRYFVGIDCSSVVIDNFDASFQASSFLTAKGCRKVGTIMYDSKLEHYKDRFNGYVQAIKRADMEVDGKIIKKINIKSVLDDMEQAIKELIHYNVDSLYFQTNTLAAEGLKHLLAYNRDFFKEIKVVVFDQNAGYDFLDSFVPFIKQPIEEMARKALVTLINQINDEKMENVNYLLDTELVISKVQQKRVSVH